jgi:hypothetical protein
LSNLPIYKKITACRGCGGSNLKTILELGTLPIADRLVDSTPPKEPEPRIPLTLTFCPACTLVQIKETVAPDVLFCNSYPYFTSVSPQLVNHFRESAESLIRIKNLNQNSLVIEAASNDGCMLKNFMTRGIGTIGIDPSDAPVQAANEHGINTINDFFSSDLAKSLRKNYPDGCDLFLANNVLAHVDSLGDFIDGISILLSEEGLAVIEVPYLLNLIEKCEFDTIYHQHLCYFSLTALVSLFEPRGLHINQVESIKIHGGSLRLYIEKKSDPNTTVHSLLKNEKKLAVDQFSYYENFTSRIESLKFNLVIRLKEIKDSGSTIAGYGAAAKACTLLNYCGINADLIPYIADKNSFKHRKFMGGCHIPIVPVTKLDITQPDYLLILAWNFSEEIMEQLSDFKNNGGKFIIPIPEVVIR